MAVTGLAWKEKNYHPYELIMHHSGLVVIDKMMVPFIRVLWKVGIDTDFCCQGYPERMTNPDPVVRECASGYVSIVDDRQLSAATRLLTEMGCTGIRPDQRAFRPGDLRGCLRFNPIAAAKFWQEQKA